MQMSKDSVSIIAYKGFGKDWKCREFQFELGKTYEHNGTVKACESGFHSCEYPLDVFRYYAPSDSVFAVVEPSGDLSRHSEDGKIASSSLTVKASIDLPGIIKAAIEYTMSRVKPAAGAASNSGYSGAASNLGQHGIAADFNGTGKAMSCAGGAIVCVCRNEDGAILHIRASKVGENGIKPDTWYRLDDAGEFVEVLP